MPNCCWAEVDMKPFICVVGQRPNFDVTLYCPREFDRVVRLMLSSSLLTRRLLPSNAQQNASSHSPQPLGWGSAGAMMEGEPILIAVTYFADRVFAPEEQHVYSPATTQMVRSVRSEM